MTRIGRSLLCMDASLEAERALPFWRGTLFLGLTPCSTNLIRTKYVEANDRIAKASTVSILCCVGLDPVKACMGDTGTKGKRLALADNVLVTILVADSMLLFVL